jgi:ribonucleotide monophosphatase NagD (HAD superfamily)
MDGILWSGRTPFPIGFETLNKLQKMGKQIYFFTNNSSLSRVSYQEKLGKGGYQAKKEQVFKELLLEI